MQVAERQKPPPGDLYLDHVAHFVPDLAAAGRLMESLGFIVTPVSEHRAQGGPAGTSNRCVMLDQGYIEILAPSKVNDLDTPNAQRVRNHMKRYDGVHLACFGTPDAAFERQRLEAAGFEPEPLIDLSRAVDGGETVRFGVVYVPPGKMPEGRVQYCQHLTPEVIWRPEHLRHANGVIGLARVHVVADDPAAAGARWSRFSGLLPRGEDGLVRLRAARGEVLIGTRSAVHAEAPAGPALAGYALAFRDPAAFLARCRAQGLRVDGDSVALPPALGGRWWISGPQA
jgi:hypothetical protein